ncbi:AbrB/MazE/SpoVT family DNA-binding domain-containing protein [Paenibacillus sp. FSL K6-2524]|uniref:AbrB/MazE/SpoVT family DNA-binding domain-containing protein n=1 Tax=Paenibacillus sp. FSL K6-2524 TaxID=2954516 RepID=UPI0030F88F9D
MKSTGIVRRIDDLGRVVIPKEIRRTLGVKEGDPLEIFVEGDKIILKKYQPGCHICSSVEDKLHPFYGHQICDKCVEQVAKYSDKIKEGLANVKN